MTKETSQLLQLAKLQNRKGDLHEALVTAEEGLKATSTDTNPGLWLEFQRLYIQSSIELEQPDFVENAVTETLHLLASKKITETHEAQAETILASCLFYQKKTAEAESYVNSAIFKATQRRDIHTLARALLLQAFKLSFDSSTHALALQYLEKIDILLPEIENAEISFTAKTIRGYIYIEKGLLDQALDVLWGNYEMAKQHGFILSISGVLAQIARVFRLRNQEEQFKLYADLALKGLDKNKTPRLYNSIVAALPNALASLQSTMDFRIDEQNRLVQEKNKGLIDFKNQHILFDLALLFIKNPGKRYHKEELTELIWSQTYDPKLHDNLIYVSIKRLRTLLEPDLDSPRYVLRDRKGYYFNSQASVNFKNSQEVIL